jgi:hypothetical protein
MNEPRHTLPSAIHSGHSAPNAWLVAVALDAAATAWERQIIPPNRAAHDAEFFNIWPGEHYRFLLGVKHAVEPESIVEVGTFTGLATKVLSGSTTTVHTFDVVPWDKFEQSHLKLDDFATGSVVQHVEDLSDPGTFAKHYEVINRARLIFLDGPKDAVFEPAFLDLLGTLEPLEGRILVIDDIRVPAMLQCWHNITWPKMDCTSLGHWSGTGLVDLSKP